MKRVLPAFALGCVLAFSFFPGPGGLGGRQGSAAPAAARFVAIVLGAGGGPSQDDLSAYLLAPAGALDFVALDTGTLLPGIRKAHAMGSLRDVQVPPDSPLTPEGFAQQGQRLEL